MEPTSPDRAATTAISLRVCVCARRLGCCCVHHRHHHHHDASSAATAPCGTKPAGTPTVTLVGGSYFSVLFQQNLNHYNPGWPGFLDVAWAIGTNQTSDDGFTILSQIPDYWPHLQAQQTNFSVPILVPNIDCDHCTLRVRYHPNSASHRAPASAPISILTRCIHDRRAHGAHLPQLRRHQDRQVRVAVAVSHLVRPRPIARSPSCSRSLALTATVAGARSLLPCSRARRSVSRTRRTRSCRSRPRAPLRLSCWARSACAPSRACRSSRRRA